MSEWTDNDSSVFRDIANVAVPRRAEMLATMVALIPFGVGEAFKVIEIGAGEGRLGAAILDCFPQATLVALDGSESMRAAAAHVLEPFGSRASVRAFELASLDWWDVMRGADVVVSSLCLHHLNDAKKQYLFRAAAERISPRGVVIVGDIVEAQHPCIRSVFAERWDSLVHEQAIAADAADQRDAFHQQRWNYFRFPDAADRPSPLFFQLMWLKHAGFAVADCVWAVAGHAVFAGFKSADPPPLPPPDYGDAFAAVSRALAIAGPTADSS